MKRTKASSIQNFFRAIRLKIWSTNHQVRLAINSINERRRKLANKVKNFLEIIIVISIFFVSIYTGSLLLEDAGIKDDIPGSITLIENQLFSIAKIFLLILLFMVFYILLKWLSSKGKETVILAFENATGCPQYDKYNQAITDSLMAELQHIRRIHNSFEKQKNGSGQVLFPSLSPSIENLEDSIAEISTLGVGKNKISIGQVLFTLRRLWPIGGKGKVVMGSIQKYGESIRLVARIEHEEIAALEVTRSIDKQEEFLDLVKDMSFKVAMLLEPKISAQSWKSFKYFTLAIESYLQYMQSQSPDVLSEAYRYCEKVQREENKYNKLVSLLYHIGVAFYKEEKYLEAEKAFESAIKIEPTNIKLYSGLGNVYVSQSRYKEAISIFKIAIYLNSNVPHPYNGLGKVYDCLGKHSKAINEYKYAIKLDPEFYGPYCNLARVYTHEGEYEKAIELWREAMALQPQHYIPHGGIGWAYFRQAVEQYRAELPRISQSFSREEARDITKLEHEFATLKNAIQEPLEKASREVEIALKYALNDDPINLFNLGIIQLWQGDKDMATLYWKKSANLISGKSSRESLYRNICEILINGEYSNLKELIDENSDEVKELINKHGASIEDLLEEHIVDFSGKSYFIKPEIQREQDLLCEAHEDLKIILDAPMKLAQNKQKKLNTLVEILKDTITYNRSQKYVRW